MKRILILNFVLLSFGAFAQRGGSPPNVTTQPPVSQIACNGAIATLTIGASGTAPLSYQWYSNPRNGCEFCDTRLIDGGGYSGTNTRTLSINTNGFFGSGTYYFCVVSNRYGTVYSNDGSILIAAVPSQPTTTSASSCQPAQLTLTSSAPGRSQIIRWYDGAGNIIAGQTGVTFVTPLLSTTTNYYVAFANANCESIRTIVTAFINTVTPPTTTSNASCGPGAVTLYASGGTNGQYHWYTTPTGGTPIPGQSNDNYITGTLSTTTNYYVSIDTRICESLRTIVTATINPIPPVPSASGSLGCGPSAITLTATGGSAGQYRWYASSSGRAVLSSSNPFITPVISANTTYYVAINNGACESNRFAVAATINPVQPPPTTTSASVCLAPFPASTTLTLSASGGTAGQYRWYKSDGTLIVGPTGPSYTTPLISATTIYYVTLVNSTTGCESTKASVSAQINSTTSFPEVTNGSSCGPGVVKLVAQGGVDGEFRWYDVSSGGSSLSTNSTYSPSLTTTTTYYVATNNGTCESGRAAVTGTINTIPTAPVTTGTSGCDGSSIILNASGGLAGQYRWYTISTGGTFIIGEANSTYVTPPLSATTTYYVSIDNGTCESVRTSLVAQINPLPANPSTTDGSGCVSSVVTLIATGGSAGQYRWYTDGTTSTTIAGQTNATFITPKLTVTTTYYVSINNGTCESGRVAITAVINCPKNDPPVIIGEQSEASPGGIVTFDLTTQISDPDNNLDFTTLRVKTAPVSGARAAIDENAILTLDYDGIIFSGTDKFAVEICDLAKACAAQQFSVEVSGDVLVYNAMSPNDDGKNDFLFIQYIDLLEDTKNNHVTVFNRWGDAVFETDNYDNLNRVFLGVSKNGSQLPAGTYFYKIEYTSGRGIETGYVSLKR